jgi:hypothetical protein
MFAVKWNDLVLTDTATGEKEVFPKSYLNQDELRKTNWEIYSSFVNDLEKEDVKWVFRGLPNSSYCLLSSIERAIPDDSLRLKIYPKLIEKFKSSCHLYLDLGSNPILTNLLEIQAMMQHFGAPTRMLDWTYSWEIAGFFASSLANKTDFTIYALNETYIQYITFKMLIDKYGLYKDAKLSNLNDEQYFNYIDSLTYNDNHGFLLPVRSKRENIRQLQQKGLYTINGNLRFGFEFNLFATIRYGLAENIIDNYSKIIRRVDIPYDFAKDLLHELQVVNIGNRTLFPGIEGFARSLNDEANEYVYRFQCLSRSSDPIRNLFNDELI